MAFINKHAIHKTTTVMLAISAAFLMAACGSGSSGESESNEKHESSETATPAPASTAAPAPTPTPTSSAGSLGKTVWANNCVACHGGDTGKGSNASKTMNAIAANTGGMGILNGKVSASDANNIAAYAANPAAY